MKPRLLRIGVLIAITTSFLVPLQGAAAAQGEFQISSESAKYNAATDSVTFRIVFSEVPDFITTDEYGRQADSFQYFIVGDPTLPYPENYDSIIRGDEIDVAARLLPIRNAYPQDDTGLPESGGWGTIRAWVPFTLHGRVLMFSAPLAAISDQTGASSVSYELQTYMFGALTDWVEGSIALRV